MNFSLLGMTHSHELCFFENSEFPRLIAIAKAARNPLINDPLWFINLKLSPLLGFSEQFIVLHGMGFQEEALQVLPRVSL